MISQSRFKTPIDAFTTQFRFLRKKRKPSSLLARSHLIQGTLRWCFLIWYWFSLKTDICVMVVSCSCQTSGTLREPLFDWAFLDIRGRGWGNNWGDHDWRHDIPGTITSPLISHLSRIQASYWLNSIRITPVPARSLKAWYPGVRERRGNQCLWWRWLGFNGLPN